MLKSDRGTMYIGYTSDLVRRVAEHKNRSVFFTKRHKRWDLVYYEAYLTKAAAQDRERKLKQYGSAYHGLLRRVDENR
ncbi:GIY-YIG nuclease family protein [Candidatus Uhrbacteria bacterium]|nr:GIY-YIG nuclease family protein [Candidatus Uhrbacteria bacterium]